MRRIEYRRPVRLWLRLLALLACALCLVPLKIWPGLVYVSWGLFYFVVFEHLGFVCIHVSELENDIEALEKREVGDWGQLIIALSRLRSEQPELFEAGLELQKLNRYFWREFQNSRRYLLRSYDANSEGVHPEQEPRLAQCNQMARDWYARMEGKLAEKSVQVSEADRACLEAMKALRQLGELQR